MVSVDPALGVPARRTGARVALVVCGALVNEVRDLIGRRGWPVDVYGVAASLHMHPKRIAPAVDEVAGATAGRRHGGAGR